MPTEHWFRCTIAGITCLIEYRDDHVLGFYANYQPHVIAPGEEPVGADITVPYRADAMQSMRSRIPGMYESFGEWQLAYDVVSRGMLRFNRLTFHGACIEFNGKAYLFTAASGTGKSTHIALWGRYLGPAVQIVNGDKPIIAVEHSGTGPDGTVITACGSPWAGKEHWNRNVQVPLGAIVILRRGERNAIRPATREECLDELVNRIYLTDREEEAVKAMELWNEVLNHVPVHVLSCTISEDAVRTSFEGLTGERYEAWKARNPHR